MYKTGDFIVKANTGVCKIADILHLDITDIDKNTLYYKLIPLEDEKAQIYIPTENAHRVTRKVMTVEMAIKLITQIADVEALEIVNDKLREQTYKGILKKNDPKELIKVIKTTYLRKKERLDEGKKNTTADEYYLRLAEKNLMSELSLVLGKSPEEIHKLIVTAVKNKE
ncbi:MAG: CarD family transcriptional regulator [Lachnospiraceae bacterium]|nr:CarD family transcriptional regulator [Lachnospiraceae bacterium]